MARRVKSFDIPGQGTTPGDDATVLDTKSIQGMDAFCLLTTTGTARVFASIQSDGTLMAKQLVLCQEPPNSGDTISSQDPVFVGVTTQGIPAWFFGDYTRIVVQQEGGTAVVGVLSGAGDRF